MMYILLVQGIDKRRKGDEMACGDESWYSPCEDTWKFWDEGIIHNHVRREVDLMTHMDNIARAVDPLADTDLRRYIDTQLVLIHRKIKGMETDSVEEEAGYYKMKLSD
jgi:hypothetical protein